LVPDDHAFDALASMLDCCEAMRDAAKSGDLKRARRWA